MYVCTFSQVPAFLNVVDIAGLVKGAHEGQGLGNAFLSHINACDAIFLMCRLFSDETIVHVEGEVNPVADLEVIFDELRMKDVQFIDSILEKLVKTVVRAGDKSHKFEYETLQKVKNVLMVENRHVRFETWCEKEIEILNKHLFLTAKPIVYLLNMAEEEYIKKKNKWFVRISKIKGFVDAHDPNAIIIPLSATLESKLQDMTPEERKEFLKKNNTHSAMEKIMKVGYNALQLEYFFTCGKDEVKAWSIQKGTKAPQAAGRIHTDFEKGFIMAEVMKFDDFKAEGSESAVKAAGKYRQQGRNYVVEDGDIIFCRGTEKIVYTLLRNCFNEQAEHRIYVRLLGQCHSLKRNNIL
ncbi:unnamed protein product [Soboliphyme baturini]|uniref:OBG-type G domain-containing protein n=1 Tax=Soboliphyme baturini TaxID=241478 RepID=A0A183IUJ0_9BILA|nr:unnamed protein product [Soboliphyme baturini]